MKVHLIARADCEVYFMPCRAGIPSGKEIRGYLKAHHPYFDSHSRVDCRRRTICGKQFLLLTVTADASVNKWKSLFHPSVSTASAILSLSSWAQKNCVIDCPDERITFADVPLSRFRPDTDTAGRPADLSLASDEALLAFAAKEKIRQPLFHHRWKTSAATVLLLAGILLGASYTPVNTEIATAVEQPVPALPDTKAGTSFWDLFAVEVRVFHDAGGVIEEYSFDETNVPTSKMRVTKSDPDILSDRLGASPLFTGLNIPEISFEGNTPRFAVEYTAQILNDGEPSLGGNPFTLIRKMRGFFGDNGFILTAVDLERGPSFSVCVEAPRFRNFLAKLKQVCEKDGMLIRALHLIRDGNTQNFLVRIKLSESPLPGTPPEMPLPFPDAVMLDEVFALAERAETPEAQPGAETGRAPVGKIQTGINRTIVFVKSDTGKISVENKR